MATDRYYDGRPSRPSYPHADLNAPLPPLPQPPHDARDHHEFTASASPFDDGAYSTRESSAIQISQSNRFPRQVPFADTAAIPLQPQYKEQHGRFQPDYDRPLPQEPYRPRSPSPQSPHRRHRIRRFFTRRTPWVTYTLTLIQITVFVAELIKNAILTGTPIEIHPTINPMLGPSSYLLVAMGQSTCIRGYFTY